ncbi:MAG: homoprotocatechuate degradation operon regulator HpaR [Sulfitobacter sp.]
MAAQTEKKPVEELRKTDRSLAISLLRARETVMLPIREMLAKTGLSEQKWRVLRVVAESGPMDQTLIADRACLLLPSLTRILRAMEDDGLLERAASAQDKRKSMVTITNAGQTLLNAHMDEANEIFQRLRNKFGDGEMGALLDMLERLQKIDV